MSTSFMVQHFKPLGLSKGRINRILQWFANENYIDLKQETNGKHGTRITIREYKRITDVKNYGRKANENQTRTKREPNGNNIINNRINNNKEVVAGVSKDATTTLDRMRKVAQCGKGSRYYKEAKRDLEIVTELLDIHSEEKLFKCWLKFIEDPSVSADHVSKPITLPLFETWLPDFLAVYSGGHYR